MLSPSWCYRGSMWGKSLRPYPPFLLLLLSYTLKEQERCSNLPAIISKLKALRGRSDGRAFLSIPLSCTQRKQERLSNVPAVAVQRRMEEAKIIPSPHNHLTPLPQTPSKLQAHPISPSQPHTQSPRLTPSPPSSHPPHFPLLPTPSSPPSSLDSPS